VQFTRAGPFDQRRDQVFITDRLLKRTGSLRLARKIPITIGLLMTANMIGCNFVDADWMVIGLMSMVFFGKGFDS